MKTLKKVIILLVILAILLAILVPFVIAPVVNNINLSEIEKEVVDRSLPSTVTIKHATHSEYGHLSGNEDTIEYFSSIVIATNVDYETLKQHYAGCVVQQLTSASVQPQGMQNPVVYPAVQDRTDFTNIYVVYKYTNADTSDFMGMLGAWDKTL